MLDITPHQTPLTNETFFEFVRAHRFVVVHFWAAWNGVDVMMRKLLESQIPEPLQELIAFASFDIDPPAHAELCREHNVLNVPLLAFYRDGDLIRSFIGLRTPEVMTAYLQELVGAPERSAPDKSRTRSEGGGSWRQGVCMNETKQTRYLLAAIGLPVTVILVCVAIFRMGMPLTVYTGIVVSLCAASGVLLGFGGKRRTAYFVLALIYCVYLAFPRPFLWIPFTIHCALFDDVGGRSGMEIIPGLKFGRDGLNTKLLESYVGPLESHWFCAAIQSPYIRDGDERVLSRSVIRSEHFPEILAMLPDDEARRTVIAALVDRENCLRVHLGLLLGCLYDLNYPQGMDRESWWSRHEFLFRPEYDPYVAASLTLDWLERTDGLYGEDETPSNVSRQRRAIWEFDRGGVRGQFDFAEEKLAIQRGDKSPDSRAVELSRQIVWWSERNIK